MGDIFDECRYEGWVPLSKRQHELEGCRFLDAGPVKKPSQFLKSGDLCRRRRVGFDEVINSRTDPPPCIWLHAQARRRRSFVPSTSVASQTHQKTSNLPIPAFLIAAPGIWTLRTHCSSRDHAVVELRISVVAEREGRCCRVPCQRGYRWPSFARRLAIGPPVQ